MKTWEIERLFNEDVREKRKTGSGSFHKRGKGVKHGLSGALRTPYYYLSTKEKKKLNGEVKVTFMYETIIPIDEFRLKDEEIQKAMLTRWREIYDNSQIKKGLGIANSPYYKLIDSLNLPKKPRGGANNTGENKIRKAKAAAISNKKTLLDFAQEKEEPKQEIQEKIETEVVKLITRGLHLEYNGTYDIDSLNRLFTKLQLLVDGEPCKYNISLSLSEVQE